jgi:hypothetical protein
MDRIAALRRIEESLGEYEDGELLLPELEREVQGILRTYATEFDEETTAYRARGDQPADGLVVVATSRTQARERIEDLLSESVSFDVERVE